MEDYKKLFQQEFSPDPRRLALLERVEQYYRDTPDSMGNKEALPYWIELKKWVSEHGYSQDEFNQAKMDARENPPERA